MLTLTLLIISLFAFGQVGSALGMGSGAESLQSWQVGAALGTTSGAESLQSWQVGAASGTTSIPESPTSWQICSKSETTSGPESLTSWQVGSESGTTSGSESPQSWQMNPTLGLALASEIRSSEREANVRDSLSADNNPTSWSERIRHVPARMYPMPGVHFEPNYYRIEREPIRLGLVNSIPRSIALDTGWAQRNILSSSVLTRPVDCSRIPRL